MKTLSLGTRAQRLNPLQYKDYREFLQAHLQQKRAENPAWSYSVWARQLGLRSSSTLIMILNGQRNPGRALVRDLAKYFQMNSEEEQYFTDLVRLTKARTDVELSLSVLKQLEERNPNRGFQLLDENAFNAIANWYFLAIREMIQLPNFQEDAEWISAQLRFPVQKEKIAAAISIMLRMKLLERDPSGKLVSTSAHLDTKTDIYNRGLKKFHEETLENAKTAISTQEPKIREISGGCFAIRRGAIARAKEMIRGFQVQLCNELEAKDGDEVYQLEIAFFPLTKIEAKNE